MTERLEVRLHDEQAGWITPGSCPERIGFEWHSDHVPGPVTLTESFGPAQPAVRPEAASSFFGGYAPEGRQRERLTARRGLRPADLYGLLGEFGASVAGAVTVVDPDRVPPVRPRYERISDGDVAARLRRAAADGDLGDDGQTHSMLAGFQPKLLLARFDGQWYLPRGGAHSTHILKPRVAGRPDGLAREHYGHALAVRLGLARYQTELVGSGARQYLVIERYDRRVTGDQTVTLLHQEDAAQALGLDWVRSSAKFQDPRAPRDSRRPTAYRIAELLGSIPSHGRPVAELLRRLTFTVLIGDNDAHAKNLAILHLPGHSELADVYDAVPNLFQAGRFESDLALAIDGSFDHRRISAAHLIREAESWHALAAGEAEQVVTATLSDFSTALDDVPVPRGVPPAAVAQLAWNLERLQAGTEIGERPATYRRRRSHRARSDRTDVRSLVL